ncbi:hypothetical protein KFK09_003916 [Dendrobium nobile]|uniref:DUF4283 domain-containing protein n=1 Tax=Dendrobium nobile TaxID=94219 RepID=A0A8T3BYW3_DENNO|nr:hypothetical protein KFK09_003916 [Dendrobium nobile]
MENRRILPSDAWKNYRKNLALPVLDSSEVFNGGSKVLESFNQNFKGLKEKPLIINEGGLLNKKVIPVNVPGKGDVSNVDVNLSLKKNVALPADVPEVFVGNPISAVNMVNNVKVNSVWSRRPYVKVDNLDLGSFLSEDGNVALLHVDKELENAKKLDKALVVKVFGENIPFHMISTDLRRQWDRFGKFHITGLGLGWFLFSFEDSKALESILLGGLWWIRGQIIGLDRNLFQWSRREFARVCVRIPLDLKLPQGVWVKGLAGDFYQKVEYEGISNICSNCRKIGHDLKTCTELKGKVIMKSSSALPTGVVGEQITQVMAVKSITEGGKAADNSWTQVKHGKRRFNRISVNRRFFNKQSSVPMNKMFLPKPGTSNLMVMGNLLEEQFEASDDILTPDAVLNVNSLGNLPVVDALVEKEAK